MEGRYHKDDHRYLLNIGTHTHHEIDAFMDAYALATTYWSDAGSYIYPDNNLNLSIGDGTDLTRPTLYVDISTNYSGGIGSPSCGHIAVYSHVERIPGNTYPFNPNFFYYEPQELLNYQDVNTTFYTFCNASNGGGTASTTFGTWTMCIGPSGGIGRVFGSEINVEERRGVQAHINTGSGEVPQNSSIALALVTEAGFSAGDTCAQGYDGVTIGYSCTNALFVGKGVHTVEGITPKWLTGICIAQDAIVPTEDSPYQNEAIYLGGGSSADLDSIGIFFNGYYTTPLYLYNAICRDDYAITMADDHRILWIGGSPTVYTYLHRTASDVYWWDGATDWKLNSISATGAHNLLSTTHTDTVVASPVSGDIIYANATPKWTALAKGTDGQVLTLASGLPSWAATASTSLWTDNSTYINPNNWADFKIFDSGYVSIGTDAYFYHVGSNTSNIAGWGDQVSYNFFNKLPTGTHSGYAHNAIGVNYQPEGSGVGSAELTGALSPQSADIGFMLGNAKLNWSNASAVKGEVDGIYVVLRNGSASDGTAYLANMVMNALVDPDDSKYRTWGTMFEADFQMYHDSTFVTPDQEIAVQIGGINYSTDNPYSLGMCIQSKAGEISKGLWLLCQGSGQYKKGLFIEGEVEEAIDLSDATCDSYAILLANNSVIKAEYSGAAKNIMYLSTSNWLALGAECVRVSIGATAANFPTKTNSTPSDGDVWNNGTHLYYRIGGSSYQLDQQSGAGYLLIADIDDTPVDSETSAPISSNWAYDHVAAADPHTGYRLESADHTHQSTGAQAGKIDHGAALNGLTDDDHTNYTLLAGRSGGQTLYGGTGSGEALNLEGTTHATDGVVNIVDSYLRLDNNKPIYWKDSGSDYRNMLYMSSSDQLIIGADLATGKLLINIDGSLKTLSIDGSGFVKAS